jgi:lactoylglutathione lyase
MKVDHVAIWTNNLEQLKAFYTKYFLAESGEKYVNARRGFESYFIYFGSGARIELMCLPTLRHRDIENPASLYTGYAHIAINVESKEAVDNTALRLSSDGYVMLSTPRYTGDGYYECVFLDPDGNNIEITG